MFDDDDAPTSDVSPLGEPGPGREQATDDAEARRAREMLRAVAGDADQTATAEHSPAPDSPGPRSSAIAEGPGRVIGPYKLLQRIGEGGMGAVFMAEQERPVRRRVALKVIKPGMDTGQVIARFEAERQALALMEHPNIARVLDAGATDTGRPYFVMELVKGVPITRFCDEQRLSPAERLELFLPVCQAIQHAHQKGIIHRDLKPSNILVELHDGMPVPKVIDFGVAKAIEQRLTERTLFTEFGAVIGTLEYMSPEQAELGAIDVDTRSDVYSLGVLLYELLTGSTPLERSRLRQAAYTEVLRRIREEEPARPSLRLSESTEAMPSISAQRRLEPARLTRLVRGDLDWIVMKSLEKDRSRRYETASGLARDIRRHLDGDPVEAGPPSRSYRLRKFARKHRAALAVAGAFAVLLITATIVSVGLALWADRERLRAVVAEARAEEGENQAIEAVKRFGDVVSNNPDLKNSAALESLRKELLKEPISFFRSLRDRLQSEPDTRPESLSKLADAVHSLGLLTERIGDRQDALRAYKEARSIYERLAPARHDPGFLDALSKCNHNISNLESQLGQLEAALESLGEALSIRERLVYDDPSNLIYKLQLSEIYNNFSFIYRQIGNWDRSLGFLEQALEIRERLERENPSNWNLAAKVAETQNNIGLIHHEMGRIEQAFGSVSMALAIRDRLAREHPEDTEVAARLALSYKTIAILHREAGQIHSAIESERKAVEILDRLTKEYPSIADYARDLAGAYDGLGSALRADGQRGEALESYRKALEITRRLTRDHPMVTVFARDLAAQYNNIGLILRETGRPDQALASYKESVTIFERLARDNPAVLRFARDLGGTLASIADLQKEMEDSRGALETMGRAIELIEPIVQENPTVNEFSSQLGSLYNNTGFLEHQRGHPELALKPLSNALEIRRRLVLENRGNVEFARELARTYNNIGNSRRDMGQGPDAREAYTQALTIRSRLAAENPERTDLVGELADTLNLLGEIDLAEGQFDAACRRFHEAIDLKTKVSTDPTNQEERDLITKYYTNLIQAAEGLGDPSQASQARAELAEIEAADPRLQALDARLIAIREGEPATDNDERQLLAARAYDTRDFGLAARLWSEVVQSDPMLADDRQAQHRYNAACAAALAAESQEEDERPSDDQAKLREQAIGWLREELDTWRTLLASADGAHRAAIADTLRHWQSDPDTASIRTPEALSRLPAAEQTALDTLWNEVASLLAEAEATDLP